MPERHREARRATEQILSSEQSARRWLDRAARSPPAVLSWLTFLDGGLFWGVVLPVLLPLAVCLSTVVPPQLALAFAHVRIADTWPDNRLAALSIGLPFVLIGVGLLLAGFGRKRTVAVSGLQAALAARAPEKGTTWSCRSCGAPLVVSSGVSSARCDYCSADNLVKLSEATLAVVRSRRDRLAEVIRTAEKDWRALRSELRSSLLWRLVFGAGLVALVTTPILGSKPSFASPTSLDLSATPNELPSFEEHRKHAKTDECRSTRWTESSVGKEPCVDGACQFYALVSPLAGETIEVVGDALPVGTELSLEPRLVRFADVIWLDAVPRFTLEQPAQVARFPVSIGGWYRLHLRIPGTHEGSIVRYCVRQTPAR